MDVILIGTFNDVTADNINPFTKSSHWPMINVWFDNISKDREQVSLIKVTIPPHTWTSYAESMG